jgi:hypothetical protein
VGESLRLDGPDVVHVEVELRRVRRDAPRNLSQPRAGATHHRTRAAALRRAVVVPEAADAVAYVRDRQCESGVGGVGEKTPSPRGCGRALDGGRAIVAREIRALTSTTIAGDLPRGLSKSRVHMLSPRLGIHL